MVVVAPRDLGLLTDRVRELRERLRSAESHVCAERSRLHTEAWRQSEGESLDIRWARMFEKLLSERTIAIRAGELIVGSETKYLVGGCPDLAHDVEPAMVLHNESFTMRGETERGNITAEERRSILEDVSYWDGKSVQCKVEWRWREIFGPELERAFASWVIGVECLKSVSSLVVDYRRVLAVGLRGIIAEVELEISKLTFRQPDDLERYNFLRAVKIVLEAAITFARRYAALARELAETESDPLRRRELLDIAAVCDRVPEVPPETFREAVQSYWFVYLCAHMESPSSVGRLDQYLYPFYKKDLDEGHLTESQAGELVALLWIKFNGLTQFQSDYAKKLSQGELFQYATIAGVDCEGEDATNELSYLILDVVRELRLTQPAVAVTYHPGLREDFLLKAIETNRIVGGGIPAFLNGTMIVSNLVNRGFSPRDARDASFHGCVHAYAAESGMLITCNINAHKMFELALNDGIDPATGEQLGPATGDAASFHTFEDLFAAFKAQYAYWVDLLCRAGNVALLTKKENSRSPFHSALTRSCLASGRDVLSGGWKYRQFEASFNARGLQNIANSMVAIRKLVFEGKKVTMAELLGGLRCNFEGRDDLRQQLLAAPKWGNDHDEVDRLHTRLWDWTTKVCQESNLQPWVQRAPLVRRGGATWHYVAGKSCGAFPDGRKAGEPMGDGTVSPVAGTDLKGPTAVVNSASKLDQTLTISNLFNMKFSPNLLKSEENKRKLLALITTYFERGGYHVQFNMVDKDVLLDAKAHPENHRDLVVRIAGFSAYFVDLVPAIQDDIIARTEQFF